MATLNFSKYFKMNRNQTRHAVNSCKPECEPPQTKKVNKYICGRGSITMVIY